MSNAYDDYYMSQAGSGLGTEYFSGPLYQKGSGIGNIFSNIFRRIIPFFSKIGPVIGSQLIRSGANTISDLSRGGVPRDVLKKNLKEGSKNIIHSLADMVGQGKKQIKRGSVMATRQSPYACPPSKTPLKRSKRDIFGENA